jgi:hypothetical protein
MDRAWDTRKGVINLLLRKNEMNFKKVLDQLEKDIGF